MKDKIHPKYFEKAKINCVCGNSFTTGSTKELINTEVCSACHPFFTGKEKIIDSMGRVERFKKRLELKKEPSKKKKEKRKEQKEIKEKVIKKQREISEKRKATA